MSFTVKDNHISSVVSKILRYRQKKPTTLYNSIVGTLKNDKLSYQLIYTLERSGRKGTLAYKLIGTQRFFATYTYSLAQKLWVLLLNFNKLNPNL